MISLDRSAERWLVAHRVGALDSMAVLLSWIGQAGLVWLLLAALLALLQRRPAILLLTASADLITSGLTTLIKHTVDRPRPPRALHVHALVHASGPSFPSGHASESFACAVVLVWIVRRPEARAALLLLAAAIAASRAYAGVHYPLDVLGGALLGSLVGALVVLVARPLERRWLPPGPRRESG